MRLRRLARHVFASTPLPELMLRRRASRHITVLGYHRVVPPVNGDYAFNDSVISVTPEELARELKFLKSNLDVISMGELAAGLKEPSLLPDRPAVITFDDGYADNYTYAYPLLKDAGVPACFFLCTGLIGTKLIPWYEEWVCCLKRSKSKLLPSPFADEAEPYALDAENVSASIKRFRRQMRKVAWSAMPKLLARIREGTGVKPEEMPDAPGFMTWRQVIEMSDHHMEMGGHTRMHPILSRIDDPSALKSEVAGCFDDIQRIVGRAPLAFAYPVGESEHMSEPADAEIAAAGFQISFSFINGFAPRVAGRMQRLPRIHVSHGNDYQMFRVRTATAPIPVLN